MKSATGIQRARIGFSSILHLLTLVLLFGYLTDLYLYYGTPSTNWNKVNLGLLLVWLLNLGLLLSIYLVSDKKDLLLSIFVAIILGVVIKTYTQGDPIYDLLRRFGWDRYERLFAIGAICTLLMIFSLLYYRDLFRVKQGASDVLDDIE